MKKNYFCFLSVLFACAAFVASAQPSYTYTGKPMFQLSIKRAGIPIGSFTVELFPNIAPKHTRNFDSLVSQKFYDTTAFHRVIPTFMIQGGDPNSRHGATSTWGYGQPGQPMVQAEFSKAKHLRGILSAARLANNINSATSQFFICVAAAPNLDGNYSIYGRVTHSMSLVDTIVNAPRNAQDRPNLKHEMFVTYIGSNDSVPLPPTLLQPKMDSVGIDSSITLQLKWKAVNDGIIYDVQVSHDSLFATTDTSYSVGSTIANFIHMTGNTRYYWRVRTNNGGHFSPWTQAWRFHTEGQTTGLPSITAGDNTVHVYPNPGDEHFNFVNLSPGSKILVYDETGKLISEVISDSRNYRLSLPPKAKGYYTYNVQLNNREVAKGKLLLR